MTTFPERSTELTPKSGENHPFGSAQGRLFDPDVMGGKPCIRGMRITVGTILGLIASGAEWEEILRLYPYLEPEDIRAALVPAFAGRGPTGRGGPRSESFPCRRAREDCHRHEPLA